MMFEIAGLCGRCLLMVEAFRAVLYFQIKAAQRTEVFEKEPGKILLTPKPFGV
jgi:hypothetical protein